MESLPRVSAALEHVLTVVADEAASAVGFIRRRRVLTGALFVQALVLGFLARPEATLHQLTQTLAARGAGISPQGLAQRFGPEAAALLERVLATAVTVAATTGGGSVPLLVRFAGGVWVLDCTTVRLPDALAAGRRGCGGRTGRGTQAALKLQVRLDVASGTLEGPVLLAGRTQDTAGPLHTAPLPPDALLLADLGFWSLERLRTLGAAGTFWGEPAPAADPRLRSRREAAGPAPLAGPTPDRHRRGRGPVGSQRALAGAAAGRQSSPSGGRRATPQAARGGQAGGHNPAQGDPGLGRLDGLRHHRPGRAPDACCARSMPNSSPWSSNTGSSWSAAGSVPSAA